MKRKAHDNAKESQWISLSDLMAALMMVFLFIAISMMRSSFIERDKALELSEKVTQLVEAYENNQLALRTALKEEFADDFEKWDAELSEEDLSIVFKSPDVLFALNKTKLTPEFEAILADFFPRYIKVITRNHLTPENKIQNFKNIINEVRIEGHTDSTGPGDEKSAYMHNMNLSQGRTRSVLNFVYDLPNLENEKDWIKRHLAAVGFSSSRLLFKTKNCNTLARNSNEIDCEEDRDRSRRVTFQVITNADAQMQQILSTIKNEN
jgi:outer membrane protein OmpA-like peptidoglycan-associated protein